jgi:hypothetical protein
MNSHIQQSQFEWVCQKNKSITDLRIFQEREAVIADYKNTPQ